MADISIAQLSRVTQNSHEMVKRQFFYCDDINSLPLLKLEAAVEDLCPKSKYSATVPIQNHLGTQLGRLSQSRLASILPTCDQYPPHLSQTD